MPLYNYHCDNCGSDVVRFNTVENREHMTCDCGSPMRKLLSHIAKAVVYEYWSENLNAHVTGPKQKQRLMRERNVKEVA